MPDTSTRTEVAQEPISRPIPRQIMDREVKITRKAAVWVACSAGGLALVMFSLLFLHAAARNGWGPFGS
ncbi:MAG: hypothetical protein HUJ11_05550 [Arenibacter algicola]|nr:hypothetical protein [Arenibacter algicola]